MTRWIRLRLWFGRHLFAILASLLALSLLFLLITPRFLELASTLDSTNSARWRQWFEFLEQAHRWLICLVVAAWVFALGSSIASFLNVVAYRLPRGGSILGRSHCPHCQQRLSMWDNMPIFGWIRNAGRCRTCHLPISPRYLYVELILGTAFLIVFFAEIGPGRHDDVLHTTANSFLTIPLLDLCAFGVDALLLALVFVAALIQWERAELPRSLIVASASISVVSALTFFVVRSQLSPMTAPHSSGPATIFTVGDIVSLGGSLLTALVFGAILPLRSLETFDVKSTAVYYRESLLFASIGLIYPWRTVLVVAALTAMLLLLRPISLFVRLVPFAAVFIAVILAIVAMARWGFIWQNPPESLPWVYDAATAAIALSLSLLSRAANEFLSARKN